MIRKRNAVVIDGTGVLRSVREELPEIRENEVLIRVYASLISPGTEMGAVRTRRENPDRTAEKLHFGYSNAGEILSVRGECKGLKPGMRVAAMGAGKAVHADYVCVPVNLVVPIPDEVSFEQACYLSLAATALQAVRRTTPAFGEYGAVLGLGIVGNLAAQLYKLSGTRIIGWEGLPNRCRIAEQCGLTDRVDFIREDAVGITGDFASPYGLDFALFAFGGNADKAMQNIKSCMKVSADGHAMGRIVLVGGCRATVDGGAASGNLDFLASSRTGSGYHDPEWEYGREYPKVFVPFTTRRNAVELIRLIAEKRLLVDPITTHRIPARHAAEAGDLLLDHPDQALGVIFHF